MSPQPESPTPAPARPATPSPTPASPATLPAPVLPDDLAQLPIPFEAVDYALKGVHATATVTPQQVVSAAETLSAAGYSLDTVTGVDWLTVQQMEVVYDYFHPLKNSRVVVRARIPRAEPELPTISQVFPGANWHERETHDFFGIRFTGHPELTPFLLPEDATYHPLRKDFIA